MSKDKEEHYDVLAIGAHADDVEMGVGGTLIDLQKRGYRCAIVILTRGEMGTGGTVEIRLKEAHEAAKILGADLIKVFDWGDARLVDSYDKQLDLAAIIRQTKPKIILTPHPEVGHGRRQSHPDHIATGLITINATNLASLKKIHLPHPPHFCKTNFSLLSSPRHAAQFRCRYHTPL